jgi:hypothetical protein
MYDPFDRAVGIVADRIRQFLGSHHKFSGIGNELAPDRIVGVIRIDKLGDDWRDGNRIALSDGCERRAPLGRHETRVDQFGRSLQTSGSPHGRTRYVVARPRAARFLQPCAKARPGQ